MNRKLATVSNGRPDGDGSCSICATALSPAGNQLEQQ